MTGGYAEDYPDAIHPNDYEWHPDIDHVRKQHAAEMQYPGFFGHWLVEQKLKSDWLPIFAALAMNALMTRGMAGVDVPRKAWEMADAMVRGREAGEPMNELPEDWTPDIPTLEFIGCLMAKEFIKLSHQFELVARGSDRHDMAGRMKILGATANFCKQCIDAVNEGKFKELVQPKQEDKCLITTT